MSRSLVLHHYRLNSFNVVMLDCTNVAHSFEMTKFSVLMSPLLFNVSVKCVHVCARICLWVCSLYVCIVYLYTLKCACVEKHHKFIGG